MRPSTGEKFIPSAYCISLPQTCILLHWWCCRLDAKHISLLVPTSVISKEAPYIHRIGNWCALRRSQINLSQREWRFCPRLREKRERETNRVVVYGTPFRLSHPPLPRSWRKVSRFIKISDREPLQGNFLWVPFLSMFISFSFFRVSWRTLKARKWGRQLPMLTTNEGHKGLTKLNNLCAFVFVFFL